LQIIDLTHNTVQLPPIIENEFGGVFCATIPCIFLYLIYILKTYDDVTTPLMNYNKDIINTKKMLYELSINKFVPNKHEAMNKIDTYFSFLNTFIEWTNKNDYFVNEEFPLFLKRALSFGKRFLFISIIVSDKQVYHANIIVFDTKQNNLYLFEPYGYFDSGYNKNKLDTKIISLFQKCVEKKINYYNPKRFMKYAGFQHIGESNFDSIYNGDFAGYCLAWSYWFLELILLNPDVAPKILLKLALKEIQKIKDEPIQTYIRGYAKHLDNERLKILQSFDIPKELIHILPSYGTTIVSQKEKKFNKLYIKGINGFVEQYLYNVISNLP
jgi:hypothetical protein